MNISVKDIFCGKDKKITNTKRKEFNSSYQKKSLNNASYSITELGFTLDDQSDKENHGGVDKAICAYSFDYYKYLEETYTLVLPTCAFGENLSLLSITDGEICLGDRFTYGEVILEVSQPRQPCWKISTIIGIKNLTAIVVKEFKTGFYFRVIKGGEVTPKDSLELLWRVYPKFTIEYINKIAFNAKDNQENIKEVLKCPKLADAYKLSLQRRYKNKEFGLQDWQV
ncbi:MAG: MOSC domain-containing protein [Sulfurimonas sp.]|nr:MOSC domain-containing protein [Sulfurimonas sp.]